MHSTWTDTLRKLLQQNAFSAEFIWVDRRVVCPSQASVLWKARTDSLLSGIQNHCEPRNVLQVTKGRWSDSRSISAAQLVWINDHNYLLREVHHQYPSEPLLARRPHIAAQVRQAEKYCRPILYFRSMLLRNFILISEECTEFRHLWILQVKRNCIEIVLHWPEQVDMEWNSNKRLTKRKCKLLMPRAIRLWLKDFFIMKLQTTAICLWK